MALFSVRIMLARQLTREIEAETPEIAVAIGKYLYHEISSRHFEDSGEELLDVDAEAVEPGAGA